MIHDEEIIGLIHNKKDKALTLYLNNGKTLIYREVFFFHFDNFSDQNIVFDIYDFDSKKISKEVIEDFPCLLPFINDQEIYKIYYIHSSVGMYGVVISYP